MRRRDFDGLEGKLSIEDDLLVALAARGQLRAKRYDGFFIDIGIPESYSAAQIAIPKRLSRPALFLDRDGVLNHDDGYVGSFERLRWIDGAIDLVKLANDLGFFVFVVTNQAGVGRGFYYEGDVALLHEQMACIMRDAGASVDDWRYCPFHPDAAIDAYRREHPWRKPNPGMLLDLMEKWPVVRGSSLMVGDMPKDLSAAAAAGIDAIHFNGGNLFDAIAPDLRRRWKAFGDGALAQ